MPGTETFILGTVALLSRCSQASADARVRVRIICFPALFHERGRVLYTGRYRDPYPGLYFPRVLTLLHCPAIDVIAEPSSGRNRGRGKGSHEGDDLDCSDRPGATVARHRGGLHHVGAHAVRRQRGRGGRSAPGEPDRKSTRLNSSHGYISYAVFCLKKKKKKAS